MYQRRQLLKSMRYKLQMFFLDPIQKNSIERKFQATVDCSRRLLPRGTWSCGSNGRHHQRSYSIGCRYDDEKEVFSWDEIFVSFRIADGFQQHRSLTLKKHSFACTLEKRYPARIVNPQSQHVRNCIFGKFVYRSKESWILVYQAIDELACS
jgi:hypothetical protein